MHAVKLPASLVETKCHASTPVESAKNPASQIQTSTGMSSTMLEMAKIHASIVQATGAIDCLESFEGMNCHFVENQRKLQLTPRLPR
jgi:hypothetical protein